jgi:hypothetical protein
MKTWSLIICIIVILALVCSPVLAISKSDLMAYYRTTPVIPAYPDTTPGQAEDTETGTPAYFPIFIIDILPFPNWSFWTVPDLYIKPKVPIDSIVKPPINPYIPDLPSKKPNIYLYSDRDLTAQVRLAPEEDITISEPVYQPGKGWQAEIRDGSLNGNGDFLFYEGMVPDAGWQKEQGYVIRADYREQDMASMLGQYNFNEKETVEFIEYWSQHLADGEDYVFYPQETGAVDRVMPLSITPKPDHVMRIWFYAEPLVSAPEPVTSPETILREGFYVVEWGVVI